MNGFDFYLDGSVWLPYAIRLSLTLLHFVWQGLLVGSAAMIALKFCNRKSANARYLIASVAFFSLPLLAVATFLLIETPADVAFLSRGSTSGGEATSVELLPSMESDSSEQPLLIASSGLPDVVLPSESQSLPPLEVMAAVEIAPETPSPKLTGLEVVYPFLPLIAAAYVMGALWMLLRLQLRILRGSRLCSRSPAAQDPSLLDLAARLAKQAGLKCVPAIRYCDRVVVPTVVGILKPVVLVPASLISQLTPDELTAILNHELAHIRRLDPVVQVLQKTVEALLFFHPTMWWLSHRIRVERENCCDDIAARDTGQLSYAAALLRMAELCVRNDPKRSSALASLAADGNNPTEFASRIRRLIGADDTPSFGLSRRGVYLLVAIGLLASVSFAASASSQPSSDESSEDETMMHVFSPEPVWQTVVESRETRDDLFSDSPFVVGKDRIFTCNQDFDLNTGKCVEPASKRLDNFVPFYRRKSADRKFIIEVGQWAVPENTFTMPTSALRALRCSDGQQVGALMDLQRWVTADEFSADVELGGDFVLLGENLNENRGVHVYRVETGGLETTLPVETTRIDAVAFSPDREWLVVSDQNRLHFWRWRDQAPVKTIEVGRLIESLTFTPDGQYLAEGPGSSKDIQIRDMRTLEVVASLQDEARSPLSVSSMDISANGRYLVAHNNVMVDPTKLMIPHRIHVWDLRTRKPVFQVATEWQGRNVSFSDDGQRIVGEFNDASGKFSIAAWQLPADIVHKQVTPPAEAKDRLGDGIQWSMWGDKDGLLTGARVVSSSEGLNAGDPLRVEYRLANVSQEPKTIRLLPTKNMQFASLGTGNRIGGFGIEKSGEARSVRIEPGQIYIPDESLVSIDTTGLEPGHYKAALGSAFFYPDKVKKSTTHGIPHRGSLAFKILGKPAGDPLELPKSDIQWGKPVAGLQFGAKWRSEGSAFTIGSTVEADLFVANITSKSIKCVVEMPHHQDGWQVNVDDPAGSTISLKRAPTFSGYSPRQFIPLQLASGEIAQFTGEGVKVVLGDRNASENDGQPTLVPTPKFQIVGDENAPVEWYKFDNSPRPNLVTRGGRYHAIFGVTLHRPDIPGLRLNLSSANTRFSAIGPDSRMAPPWPEKTSEVSAGTGTDDKVQPPTWGEESHGLRCRILPVSPTTDAKKIVMTTPLERFASPDDITFAVEIENVSDKPITFVSETGRQGDTLQIKGRFAAKRTCK